MALFSRGKKSNEPSNDAVDAVEEGVEQADAAVEADATDAPEAAPAPNVNISVGSFQGLGSPAGVLNQTPAPSQPAAPAEPVPVELELPRSPANPPENTQTIEGYTDNVLLRETLARVHEEASGVHLVGVLRNMLQGPLYVRVPANSQDAIKAGQPVPVGVARNEAGESYLLVFSSAKALFDSIKLLPDPQNAAGMAQPASLVLKQVVDGEYSGVVVDNDSAPHRAVFPKELIARALAEGDPEFRVKTLLTQPRSPEGVAQVALALTQTPIWVAVGQVDGGSGIAEANMSTGKRYVQLFSHPIEVAAMGRGEQPGQLTPAKLRKVLEVADHTDGVLIDPAGPSMIIPRDLLVAAFEKAGVEAE